MNVRSQISIGKPGSRASFFLETANVNGAAEIDQT